MHEGHRERLRERYKQTGLTGMADHNALELLLTYAIPRRDTNETAHRLLNAFGSLGAVLRADVAELEQVEGIGESSAVFLHLIFEIQQRMMLSLSVDAKARLSLKSAQDTCRYPLTLAMGDRYETLRCLALDSNLMLLNSSVVATGDLEHVAGDARRVLERALQSRAHSFVLVHNHPSGVAVPSEQDYAAADRLNHAAEAVGVPIRDQLIVGAGAVYSFFTDTVLLFSAGGLCHSLSLAEYYETLRPQQRYSDLTE